jgi:predicted nucleic acid-binding Zn ribbon protein
VTRRCPQCGRTFPAGKKFCDQDASALVPARRRVRLLIPLLMIAALIAGGVIWGPALARRYLLAHLSVSVGDVEFRQGANFLPDLVLVLRVRNTSGLSVSLRSARLTCAVGGAPLVALEGPPAGAGPLAIPSGSAETEMRFQVKPKLLGLGGLGGMGKLPGGWETSCKGPVAVSVWGMDISRDVAVKDGFQ